MTDPASPTDDTVEADDERADDDRADGEGADADGSSEPGQEPVTVAPDTGPDDAGDTAPSGEGPSGDEPSAGDESAGEATGSAGRPADEDAAGDDDAAGSTLDRAESDEVAGNDGADADATDSGPTGGGGVEESAAGDDGQDDEESDAEEPTAEESADDAQPGDAPGLTLPPDVRKYDRFKKMDGAQYERVNEFLRDRTYITAREWAIARLCADFRTETGVEMTKIGEHLPYLVPFMTDSYTPQAVNQARHAFEEKVRKAGATFLYGAMCDFFTADEIDDLMYEVTEVAKFLLEVEGVDLTVEEELEAEERISSVMREVRQSSDALRHEGVCCPECGHEFEAEGHEIDEDGEEVEAASETD